MAFWSTNNVEPTRQYRFTISDGSGVWWWAKSCDKPSFEIETQELRFEIEDQNGNTKEIIIKFQ